MGATPTTDTRCPHTPVHPKTRDTQNKRRWGVQAQGGGWPRARPRGHPTAGHARTLADQDGADDQAVNAQHTSLHVHGGNHKKQVRKVRKQAQGRRTSTGEGLGSWGGGAEAAQGGTWAGPPGQETHHDHGNHVTDHQVGAAKGTTTANKLLDKGTSVEQGALSQPRPGEGRVRGWVRTGRGGSQPPPTFTGGGATGGGRERGHHTRPACPTPYRSTPMEEIPTPDLAVP